MGKMFLFTFVNERRSMSLVFVAPDREQAFDMMRDAVKYPFSWVLYSMKERA